VSENKNKLSISVTVLLAARHSFSMYLVKRCVALCFVVAVGDSMFLGWKILILS